MTFRTVRLRRLLVPKEESNRPDLPVLSVYRDHGVVPKDSRSDNFNKTPEDVSRYLHVRPGDLVVNKMKAWSGSVAVSAHEGIVSGDYLVCAVSRAIDSRFLHHLLRSSPMVAEMRRRSKGIRPSQERLYWDDLADISVRIPDLAGQRTVAQFLDQQVALVEEGIALRLAQLDLAHSRLPVAVENEVFGCSSLARVPAPPTSGLGLADPFPATLPMGWSRTRFKSVATKVSRPNRGRAELLSVYLDRGVIPFEEAGPERVHNPSLDLSSYQLVQPGDLVMNNQQAWRGSVGVSDVAGIVSPAYHVYRLDEHKLDRQYANFLFRSRPMVALYEQVSRGVGSIQRNLDGSGLSAVPVVYPSLAEQCERAGRATEAIARHGQLLDELEASALALEERKRALITAAVTGEFEVASASLRRPTQ